MADLIATSNDLALYLGLDDIDIPRAEMLLAQAQVLCESLVTPLPAGASAVILSATARAFSNPTQVTSEMIGPYQTVRPSGGVYLTKAERATLRRLAGGGGAFSFSLLPAGYPASAFEGDA